MVATTLALNAFALTGESRYKAWLLEYVDAWCERAGACAIWTMHAHGLMMNMIYRMTIRLIGLREERQ